jgi:uncharacterized protein (TIGR02147 family)
MLLQLLRDEFKERTDRNSQYSLRAFARALKIHSSTLSAILNEKRRITPVQAQKILRELQIDGTEKKQILLQLIEGRMEIPTVCYEELNEATLSVIEGWEHFALLACLDLDKKAKSTEQLARKMKLPLQQTAEALERLQKLNLVLLQDDQWTATGKKFTTTQDIPSQSLRKANREYIAKALDSQENYAVQDRDVSGITMAISTKKLPQAKKLIAHFRRELAEHLECGQRDEVYRLNIQLFPLSK